MDKDTIVFALATQDELAEKMLSNIVEVSARDAYVVSITKEKNDFFKDASEMVLYLNVLTKSHRYYRLFCFR